MNITDMHFISLYIIAYIKVELFIFDIVIRNCLVIKHQRSQSIYT